MDDKGTYFLQKSNFKTMLLTLILIFILQSRLLTFKKPDTYVN